MFKSFWAYFTGGVTILSGVATLYDWIVQNQIDKEIILAIKITFFIFLFITLFYILFFELYLKKRGINKIPLKFNLFLKKFNPFLLSKFVYELHAFQHELEKAKSKIIIKNLFDPLCLEGREISATLMGYCQKILRISTGVDFSVNIKLFEKVNNDESSYTPINDTILATYERFPSPIERKRLSGEKKFKQDIKDKLHARCGDEKFIIEKWKKNHLDNLINTVKSYKGSYKKNYAYDFVLGPSEHYWLSNSLTIDAKNNNFHSTSENYEKYYNSLGVFLISPGQECGEYVDTNKVIGLIIIDSYFSNVFHRAYVKDIMGYFAHRFYHYFMNYPIFKLNGNENRNVG